MKEFEPLPEGKYRLSIVSAKGAADKYGGLILRHRIVDGPHQGHEFTVRVFPNGGTMSSLLETLLEGKQVYASVRQRAGKNGRPFSVVDHYSQISSGKGPESSGEGSA